TLPSFWPRALTPEEVSHAQFSDGLGGLRKTTARHISTSMDRPHAAGHVDAIICPQFRRLWRDTLESTRGGSRVAPTIRIRREPSQYCRTEWGHRQSSSARAQRRRKTWGRNARYQGQSHWRGEEALA